MLTLTPDERALLAAVIAEPSCDVVRGAFADMLQGNAGTVACGITGIDQLSRRKTVPQHPILSEPILPGRPYPKDQILVCDRFEERTLKGNGDECWLWIGSKDKYGYGRISFGRHWFKAHRVAFQFAYGVMPKKLFVCHSCDVPLCVRPDHLFAGTHQDNMADMRNKGRAISGWKPMTGEENSQSKLTERDVFLIRRLSERGIPKVLIAGVWEISFQHITDIVNRRKWTHV